MSVPHEQKPEITEAAAGSNLRLRSREQAESSSKYTPTCAYNEDSELHNGIAELGNELIDQPRQQEGNNDVVFSEAPMQIVSVCTGWHEGRQSDISESQDNVHSHGPSQRRQPISLGYSSVAKGSSSNTFPARATIIAGGAEVYIAYTGLDCIYIEALPEHMREEVLNQYFQKQRPAKEKLKTLVPLTPKLACKLQYEAHIGTLLEALSLLVTANVRISNCRLAEQAVPVVLNKRLTKKGKCKEKGNTTVTYPLVGLLALLDYDSLFKQPNLTEFITGLLALIGRYPNDLS
ncbi:hypothetical protein PPACK8108_LOCUS2175 [Phakopsora pachyrhizi]|uniref:Uncharacterized protein n=1 Tax=Phakopsora pachyrhizi TaxID=170000 RepID=A0AAV0AL94_PHAPC|nr:hypothetical protein PPACK8108_LOCUS2175 [Phakopsora pachyrhizi]